MKSKNIFILTSIITSLIIIVVIALTYVSISNKEIDLRNSYSAELDHNKMVKNKTWNVIKKKANILDKYSADFMKAFNGIMDARYKGDDQVMFKWIQEKNPNFSTEMYKDLSDAIESQSTEFLMVQTRLRDIKREHDNLLKKFPTNLVVGKRSVLEAVVLISKKTSYDFETKIDSDTENLYNNSNKAEGN